MSDIIRSSLHCRFADESNDSQGRRGPSENASSPQLRTGHASSDLTTGMDVDGANSGVDVDDANMASRHMICNRAFEVGDTCRLLVCHNCRHTQVR